VSLAWEGVWVRIRLEAPTRRGLQVWAQRALVCRGGIQTAHLPLSPRASRLRSAANLRGYGPCPSTRLRRTSLPLRAPVFLSTPPLLSLRSTTSLFPASMRLPSPAAPSPTSHAPPRAACVSLWVCNLVAVAGAGAAGWLPVWVRCVRIVCIRAACLRASWLQLQARSRRAGCRRMVCM